MMKKLKLLKKYWSRFCCIHKETLYSQVAGQKERGVWRMVDWLKCDIGGEW
ncbi:hypothetical protein HanRHA438_Chr10g0475121 [Helianthus annuus]|nr:hypothetical protein HanRHA438_Chr10g0475121 [Helianthus annuus]